MRSLHRNPASCPTTDLGTNKLAKNIQNSDPSKCIFPLEGGSSSARLTLKRFFNNGTLMTVRTTVSAGTACNAPGTTVMMEFEDSPRLIECGLVQVADESVDTRICSYICNCERLCSRIHLEFVDLSALMINNTQWELCNVQICTHD